VLTNGQEKSYKQEEKKTDKRRVKHKIIITLLQNSIFLQCNYLCICIFDFCIFNKNTQNHKQERPVNVKYGARCAMGKVEETKTQRGGILMYYYKFAVIG